MADSLRDPVDIPSSVGVLDIMDGFRAPEYNEATEPFRADIAGEFSEEMEPVG